MKMISAALVAFITVSTLVTAYGVYRSATSSVTPLSCPSVCTIGLGQRLSNFLLLSTNPGNDTVSGLSYIIIPVAYEKGYPRALRIGDTIGYACDGSEYNLTFINFQNQTATFAHVPIDTHNCPG